MLIVANLVSLSNIEHGIYVIKPQVGWTAVRGSILFNMYIFFDRDGLAPRLIKKIRAELK